MHKNYFDYAAATPVSESVLQAMLPYFTEYFYNPSSLYSASKMVHAKIEETRAFCAGLLQVRASEIYFTAGSTEANNIAIQGCMALHPEATIAVSAVEHDAVRKCAMKYKHSIVEVDAHGVLDLVDLAKKLTDDVVLFACMSANNEIGTMQPLHEVANCIAKVRQDRKSRGVSMPLYLHVDASQSFQYDTLLPHKIKADTVVISGGKLYGPKQTAVLYKRADVKVVPILSGGGQEIGLRSGTENVPGIIGLVAAMKEAVALQESEKARLVVLRSYFINKLQEIKQDCVVSGHPVRTLPHIVNVLLPGYDAERVVLQLDQKGFYVSSGSACHASSDEPSFVLKAIGLTNEQAQTSVRISFGRHTTKSSVDQLLGALTDILAG